ncbi:MAG: hybrid sensor histidine kinase/response regulator [Anaerolineae bacterium]|nr:hybrid sensor histidine kinase/response regulator [Anaerolineae bacterium]
MPLLKPAEDCSILIVDDDERILDVFTTILSRHGYRVYSTQNGKPALELIGEVHPDVIVLDVVLPDIDGIEVCRRVKENPSTRFVPVILITGLDTRSRRLEGLNVRADDFLNKPIDPLELTARVRSSLRTKLLYDEVEASRRDLERRVDERTQELSRANRRLEELGQVKSKVLSVVAHELRTPIHQVKLAVNLALQEDIDHDEKRELARNIQSAFTGLEYRLDEIEQLSDPTDLKCTDSSINAVITAAIVQVQKLSGIDEELIQLNLESHLPPVYVDPKRITRAVAHLIDNANKFGEGKPISISTYSDRTYVCVCIEDHGTGISEEVKPNLFSPLESGDNSDTRRYGGMGIGLAFAKAIFDAHEIAFSIDSLEGEGTTAMIYIPIQHTGFE